jgi:hypothetical protein
VVFDHVIVVAGRGYIAAARRAAVTAGAFAKMDEWMRPAMTRGLWIATASGAFVLLTGLTAVARARRRPDPR